MVTRETAVIVQSPEMEVESPIEMTGRLFDGSNQGKLVVKISEE